MDPSSMSPHEPIAYHSWDLKGSSPRSSDYLIYPSHILTLKKKKKTQKPKVWGDGSVWKCLLHQREGLSLNPQHCMKSLAWWYMPRTLAQEGNRQDSGAPGKTIYWETNGELQTQWKPLCWSALASTDTTPVHMLSLSLPLLIKKIHRHFLDKQVSMNLKQKVPRL